MESTRTNRSKRPSIIGKDEMNLLEYCVFSATNRIDKKTKSLVFEDPVYCPIERRQIVRKLTVAFSAEYGRPTARDDLVLVAMMKKSRDDGFNSQRVYFTRYELLRILGWAENGQSYSRVDQALNRIIGTHLVWDNAFWDNQEKSWVDRKFSIIDDVHLYDREKFARARERLGEPNPKSWFKWSDVMFESFQAGYIKSVDLELLKSLQENVAKRLYRWLDKHFNNPKRRMPIEIPIAKLATQKLGFQKAPASHLQRMLAPAIKELEAMTYLAPETVRFTGKGQNCKVCFRPIRKKMRKTEQLHQELVASERSADTSLACTLKARGVSPGVAAKWAREDPEKAQLQLEHLDWLMASDWKPKKGTGAWLCAAMKDNYQPPAGFQTKAELQAKREQTRRQRKQREEQGNRQHMKQQQIERKREERVANFLSSISKDRKQEIEEQAVAEGDNFLQRRLNELEQNGEAQMAAVYREKMVSDYVETLLQSGEASHTSAVERNVGKCD